MFRIFFLQSFNSIETKVYKREPLEVPLIRLDRSETTNMLVDTISQNIIHQSY